MTTVIEDGFNVESQERLVSLREARRGIAGSREGFKPLVLILLSSAVPTAMIKEPTRLHTRPLGRLSGSTTVDFFAGCHVIRCGGLISVSITNKITPSLHASPPEERNCQLCVTSG